VKGTIAKRLFNGDIEMNDSNLVAHLNGLVDMSQAQPRFDLTASIGKSNLKRLKLYTDDIDFNGDILFNFTGSNIDNFLGSAKIFNSSIYKDGQRISFDSLTLESNIIGKSKSISVLSNEFDAMLVGEFSIIELPNAFQVFLNRYFPELHQPFPQNAHKRGLQFRG
jgi:hypothetical protein